MLECIFGRNPEDFRLLYKKKKPSVAAKVSRTLQLHFHQTVSVLNRDLLLTVATMATESGACFRTDTNTNVKKSFNLSTQVINRTTLHKCNNVFESRDLRSAAFFFSLLVFFSDCQSKKVNQQMC